MAYRDLTAEEIELLNRYTPGWSATTDGTTDREFDVHVIGTDEKHGCTFAAWLPLAVIYDHPAMWLGDDWSETRDADREIIWELFNEFVAYRRALLFRKSNARSGAAT